MLAITILLVGILSRFIFHVPNFTPVLALAFFSGLYVNKKWSLLLPLALFILSDLFLGLHSTILFTWGSVLIIACIGLRMRGRQNMTLTMGGSLLSAVIFFVVTNFGVWLMFNTYAPTWAGLVQCYMMAIPFFRSTLAGTLVYTVVLVGLYEIIARRVKTTRFATVLLS
ncbi:MAG: hypothetical protein K8S27_01755 [Candidatus Omnitrophica bacterium]|nr:hypothetical protein [Candidatus Omnitrophota bacterium]